ncbi:hypothetical protein SAXI111661_07505 [Saccharomonospora xinjiangensis]|nr:hypothetical protein EYD13_04740 [Saccharomonospora xinjiangensis]
MHLVLCDTKQKTFAFGRFSVVRGPGELKETEEIRVRR